MELDTSLRLLKFAGYWSSDNKITLSTNWIRLRSAVSHVVLILALAAYAVRFVKEENLPRRFYYSAGCMFFIYARVIKTLVFTVFRRKQMENLVHFVTGQRLFIVVFLTIFKTFRNLNYKGKY